MYYLAFFLNYQPFLEQKLTFLFSISHSSIYLNYDDTNKRVNTWNNLYEIVSSPNLCNWLLYSSSQKISSVFWHDLYLSRSYFNQIDLIFYWLSENSIWSIIPWGIRDKRANSFLFLSKDQSLRNLFVNSSPNTMDIEEIAYIPQTNLLISQYDVPNNFSHSTQIFLSHQDKNVGNRLWNACDCNNNSPWVITTAYYEDEEDNVEPVFLWEKAAANCQFIQNFDFTIQNQKMSIGRFEVGVYQPNNRQLLVSLLRIESCEPDTLMVIPKNTNIELLKHLLSKTEGHPLYETFSYLCYVEDILKTVEWFYLVDSTFAGYGDYTYSLFIARDNALIRKFNQLNIDDDYQFLSCF